MRLSGTDPGGARFLPTKQLMGTIMARPQLQHPTSVRPVFHGPRKLYWIERQHDLWFIRFEGSDYGPYKSEREALLFAIDAASKLGEQGDDAQVLVMEEDGDVRPAWTFGHDR
jgi:hypothetical protein